jgi:tRNA threonylcarbamoyladenosine biosynthesis protein TsaE
MAIDNPVTDPPLESGEFLVRSLEETGALAAKLLPLFLKAGVVSLEGPLGAGKTHFVKATAQALGITEDVTSPTFTLLQSYGSAESRLHHSDWYRMESEEEVLALGLEDYYGDGLMLIEWGDKFPTILPPRTLRIRIDPMPDDSRSVTVGRPS